VFTRLRNLFSFVVICNNEQLKAVQTGGAVQNSDYTTLWSENELTAEVLDSNNQITDDETMVSFISKYMVINSLGSLLLIFAQLCLYFYVGFAHLDKMTKFAEFCKAYPFRRAHTCNIYFTQINVRRT